MHADRPCRCLMRDDAGQKPLYELVLDYIATLHEDERAGDAVYKERLAWCERCERLISGTCTLCGCYVEIRAAKARMSCPDVPPRWVSCPPFTIT